MSSECEIIKQMPCGKYFILEFIKKITVRLAYWLCRGVQRQYVQISKHPVFLFFIFFNKVNITFDRNQ